MFCKNSQGLPVCALFAPVMGLQRIQNAFIVHPWLRNTSGLHTFSALPQNQKQHKEKLRVRSYGPPAPGSNVYDEYSIRRLCTILADNAIKYALPGTEIFFSLKKAKKGVVITTVNECDHLEREETEKLFDRFYRADKSRNSAHSGFGIGLSAARRIVENHKGFIKAECENGHTIAFTAELR